MKIPTPLLLIAGFFTLTSAWNYRDQHLWGNEFPSCDENGPRQSPLNLYTQDSSLGTFFYRGREFPTMKFGTGWLSNAFWVTDNNDRFIVWDRYEDKSVAASISGGPLGDDVYGIEDIEFHVGDNDDTGIKHRGSEHLVDSTRFQGELQIIFRNRKYTTPEIAQEQPDGYAIISLLLKTVSKEDFRAVAGERLDKSSHTTGLRKFIRAAKRYAAATLRENKPKFKAKNKQAKRIKVDLKLGKFLSDVKNCRQYITYEGSFTSPARECKPAVRWIVYPEPIEVLEVFLIEMRSPTGNNGNLKNNWRKDIFSITRFPESNTELAGYPTWIPLGGNDPNKTERHQRFYREGLRGTAKLLGVNFKARKQIDSKLTKIFPRIAEAEAEVVLASGTDYEDEARKKLDELTAAKTALYTAWYAAVDENDNLEEDLKQKHGRIANLVRARYGGPDPR